MTIATQPVRYVTYTNAPEDLDCHDTETLAVLGIYTNGKGPTLYRRVSTPEAHVGVQRARYGASSFNAHTEAEWIEVQAQSWFAKKFTPAPEKNSMNTPADIAAFDAALTIGQSVEARWTNNNRRYVHKAAITKVNAKSVLVALCGAIYAEESDSVLADEHGVIYPDAHVITLPRMDTRNYSAANGAYPLTEEDVQSAAENDPVPAEDVALLEETTYPEPLASYDVPTALTDEERAIFGDFPDVEIPPSEQERQAWERGIPDHTADVDFDELERTETTGAAAAPSVVMSENPVVRNKIQYLLALVAQGPEAVQQALIQGKISVRMLRQSQPQASRPAGTGAPIKRKLSLEVARAVRQRLANGGKSEELAAELHVHPSTIGDIRANRIWKEPTA